MARHLTPGEKRAQQAGRNAVARAWARATPDHDDDPWPTWPPSPTAWRLRCRQIREEIDADQAAIWWPTPAQEQP